MRPSERPSSSSPSDDGRSVGCAHSDGGALRVLSPGHNCWRVEQARRVQFLVDGARYFATLAEALRTAERQICILGWDFHGGMSLLRGRQHEATPLGEVLVKLVEARPRLHVHVLIWDFSVLFALEREWTPLLGAATWARHPRITVVFDDRHPFGASHHQKVVTVDDQVAFVGGLDLTQRRWDTMAHRVSDSRRRDPAGTEYGPFHDVQVLVEGKVAGALGCLARERWRQATGRALEPPPDSEWSSWPASSVADADDVAVGISRTIPKSAETVEVREVETLYLDMIASAERSIYFENQYFTSTVIAEALERSLRRAEGPEVVMVLPRGASGWLEESTMGALRARNLRRLVEADRKGRFRAVHPVAADSLPINVHSKVTIVDRRMARVGSSNLSNRSMGLDTECDLTIETERSCDTIGKLHATLLAEHLGAGADEVEGMLAGSTMGTAIDRLGGGDRTLRPLEWDDEDWHVLVPEQTLVDPASAEMPRQSVQEFVHDDVVESATHPWGRLLVVLAFLTAAAAAWKWTPLGGWLEPQRLASFADGLRGDPFAIVWVSAIYVLATLVLFPVTGLILATALAFPPAAAVAYSLAGSVLAGLVSFRLGRFAARDTVRRLAGARLDRVSRLLARRGVLSVVALRILPVAPFTVVNVVAGASHIGILDFVAGTALGLLPGILSVNLFEAQLKRTIEAPGAWPLFALVALGSAILLSFALARRMLKTLGSLGDSSQPAGR